jgi:hypothetical protein
MSNVLGLILFVVYVVVVIGAAAGITWLVVRISPTRKPEKPVG